MYSFLHRDPVGDESPSRYYAQDCTRLRAVCQDSRVLDMLRAEKAIYASYASAEIRFFILLNSASPLCSEVRRGKARGVVRMRTDGAVDIRPAPNQRKHAGQVVVIRAGLQHVSEAFPRQRRDEGVPVFAESLVQQVGMGVE